MTGVRAACLAVLVSGALADPAKDHCTCAQDALLTLTSLLCTSVRTPSVPEVRELLPQAEASLQEIQKAAAVCALPLKGVRASLDELLTLNRPVVIHLTMPDHIAVVVDGGERWLRVASQAGRAVERVGRAELARRFGGWALVPELDTATGAVAWVDEPFHDFGRIVLGESLRHTFLVRNRGTQPLHLAVKGFSCTCTSGGPTNPRVEPGESATIPIVWQPTEAGRAVAAVTVKTSDPYRPELHLMIEAEASQALEVRPSKLSLQSRRGSSAQTTLLVIMPADGVVRNVTTTSAWLDARLLTRELRNGASYTGIEVSLPDTAPVGQWQEELRLELGDTAKAVVVPVAVEVAGILSCEPGLLFWGRVKAGVECQGSILIASSAGARWSVLGVSCSSTSVKISPPLAVGPLSYRIEVTATASVSGLLDAVLTITTDVPGEERLKVPLTLLVAR